MSFGSWLAGYFGCDRCQAMHRRAQAAESRAIRAEARVPDRYAIRLLAEFYGRARQAKYQANWWKNAYREAAAQIRESGLVDTRDTRFSESSSRYVEGRLPVLIDRLIKRALQSNSEGGPQ